MTTSAEREVPPPPSMRDLLAACAAATAVSTPPPSADGDRDEGADGEEAPAAATPAPRSGTGLERRAG
ncbi:hypothetical protein GCM10010433_01510 [Streptomyces pulveraceus]|uniref:Uncharacterized protein n=1 Tax=Streptomyces pulveraceus TaxID=68258 RepID=A0ABW1GNT6_9ACTN